MRPSPFHPSLLARDQKLFLELTPEEADIWITQVFERIRPQMRLISAMMFHDNEEQLPLNLELVLMIASSSVREVAGEMADALFTPSRQRAIYPQLNAYCDELLADGRSLDAVFIQQGLIGIQEGLEPHLNPLLVEVCVRVIFHQVSLINSGTQGGGKKQ